MGEFAADPVTPPPIVRDYIDAWIGREAGRAAAENASYRMVRVAPLVNAWLRERGGHSFVAHAGSGHSYELDNRNGLSVRQL